MLLDFELIDFNYYFAIGLRMLDIFQEIRIPDNFLVGEWNLQAINGVFVVEMVIYIEFPCFLLDLDVIDVADHIQI